MSPCELVIINKGLWVREDKQGLKTKPLMPLKPWAEDEGISTLISLPEPCLLGAPLGFQIPKPLKTSKEQQLFCYFNLKSNLISWHFCCFVPLSHERNTHQPGSNVVPCLSVHLDLIWNKYQTLLVCPLLKPWMSDDPELRISTLFIAKTWQNLFPLLLWFLQFYLLLVSFNFSAFNQVCAIKMMFCLLAWISFLGLVFCRADRT